MKSVLYVERNNKPQIDVKTMIANAKAIYSDLGNKAKDVKSLDVYIKVEENMVYFVINAGMDSEFRGEFTF